jgi:hypothetical protein
MARGSGFTVLAAAAAHDAIARGELVSSPIVEPAMTRPIYLVRKLTEPQTYVAREGERVTLKLSTTSFPGASGRFRKRSTGSRKRCLLARIAFCYCAKNQPEHVFVNGCALRASAAQSRVLALPAVLRVEAGAHPYSAGAASRDRVTTGRRH